jgi:hypothetical protein
VSSDAAKHPKHARDIANELELHSLSQRPPTSVNENGETSRVDEFNVAQVDDEPLGPRSQHRVDRRPETMCACEIELAADDEDGIRSAVAAGQLEVLERRAEPSFPLAPSLSHALRSDDQGLSPSCSLRAMASLAPP